MLVDLRGGWLYVKGKLEVKAPINYYQGRAGALPRFDYSAAAVIYLRDEDRG